MSTHNICFCREIRKMYFYVEKSAELRVMLFFFLFFFSATYLNFLIDRPEQTV